MALTLIFAGTTGSAAATRSHHGTQSVNPSMCPAPSVVGSALGIQVLQAQSHLAKGPSNTNTCNYLTSAVLLNGQPTWQTMVYYSWPQSKAGFDAELAYGRAHVVGGVPNKTLSVPHLGTEASVAANGSAITVLCKNVQMEISDGQGHIKTTEKQMVNLAKAVC
jgi:hypothetical protein